MLGARDGLFGGGPCGQGVLHDAPGDGGLERERSRERRERRQRDDELARARRRNRDAPSREIEDRLLAGPARHPRAHRDGHAAGRALGEANGEPGAIAWRLDGAVEASIERHPRKLGRERASVVGVRPRQAEVGARGGRKRGVDEPRAEGPGSVALMELQHDRVIACGELERHDVVVVADGATVVAGEDDPSVDADAQAVVDAEQEEVAPRALDVQGGRGIGDEVRPRGLEGGLEIDRALVARRDQPSRGRPLLRGAEVALAAERGARRRSERGLVDTGRRRVERGARRLERPRDEPCAERAPRRRRCDAYVGGRGACLGVEASRLRGGRCGGGQCGSRGRGRRRRGGGGRRRRGGRRAGRRGRERERSDERDRMERKRSSSHLIAR